LSCHIVPKFSTALTFPGGNGNHAWTYTATGQPSTITRQDANGGITNAPVTNSYLYDKRGLLVSEAMNQNGSTWTVGYSHDADGHLAGETCCSVLADSSQLE
jgi:hypothetical protein